MPHPATKACLMMILASLTATAGSDIYRYRDAEGRTYLSDKPLQGQYVLVKRYRGMGDGAGDSKPVDSLKRMAQRRSRLSPLIEQVARDQRLQPALIHAVVRAESAYDHKAVSSKGAIGLMQLMPATASRYGVGNAEDPRQNLSGGARYLRYLLGMFENDLSLALAAYNAGENAVIEYGRRIPPYPETRNYVRKVLAFYDELRAAGSQRASLVSN